MKASSVIWRDAFLTVFGLSCLCSICSFARYSANGEVIAANHLQSLSREQAGAGLNFHLEGTVLCYDEGWHQLYVHDGLGTAYVSPQDSPLPFRSGQFIEING